MPSVHTVTVPITVRRLARLSTALAWTTSPRAGLRKRMARSEVSASGSILPEAPKARNQRAASAAAKRTGPEM